MLNTPDNSPKVKSKKPAEAGRLHAGGSDARCKVGADCDTVSVASSVASGTSSPCKSKANAAHKGGFMTLGHKTKLKDIWSKFRVKGEVG